MKKSCKFLLTVRGRQRTFAGEEGEMKMWVAWHLNDEKPDGLCGTNAHQVRITIPENPPAPCKMSEPVVWREFDSAGVLSFPDTKTHSKFARILAILDELARAIEDAEEKD